MSGPSCTLGTWTILLILLQTVGATSSTPVNGRVTTAMTTPKFARLPMFEARPNTKTHRKTLIFLNKNVVILS